MSGLSGKAALVTGGGRGIGAAIGRRLADRGADVAMTYHQAGDQARASPTAHRIGPPTRINNAA